MNDEMEIDTMFEEEFWIIIDKYKNRVGGKYSNREKAIDEFLKSRGIGNYNWLEYRQKGFNVICINVKKTKSKINLLSRYLL